MTVVIGTAGHIDHGKTMLLRALTGIDADRLPEERARGMTIDVGYAHLAFDDGSELDFVDVPGHDRLVGNMLVGAGEIDAVLLVVAADDGVRAQTREHLSLLDALTVTPGVVVITKIDSVDPTRVAAVRDQVEALLAGTALAGSPILPASSVSGAGLDDVRAALRGVRDRVIARPSRGDSPRLAIDRVFQVKGRGVVVTGTLRGGPLARGTSLRLVPGDGIARVREVQVHGREVESAGPGRTALNLAGVDASRLHRGVVLSDDSRVVETSRVLVRLGRALPDRTRARLHLGTAAVDGAVGRSGREAIDLPAGAAAGIVRMAEPVAAAPGDRFVLRRPGARDAVVGGVVLDAEPPRGVSRRRQTPARIAVLAQAIEADDPIAMAAARLDLHGLLERGGEVALASDVADAAHAAAMAQVADQTAATLIATRTAVAMAIRRLATGPREIAATAAAAMVDDLVRSGSVVREGDRLRLPGSTPAAPDPAVVAAMDRLERVLSVVAPPPLDEAARDAQCPPDGVRALERAGRIVVLSPDLAYAESTYRDIAARAISMAEAGPLRPAALRDATGTTRKYVMAILEDLDRRGWLRRTPDGHLPGPKASEAS